jgi:hypothetical protein
MIEIYYFSYWIFIWFLLYIFGIISYNPYIFLIIGIIENIFNLIILYYYNSSIYNIIKFIVINFLIKGIPLIILIYYKKNVFKLKDFVFGLILICIYLFVLLILKKNIYKYYKKLIHAYITNSKDIKYKTYLSRLYDYIYFKYVK